MQPFPRKPVRALRRPRTAQLDNPHVTSSEQPRPAVIQSGTACVRHLRRPKRTRLCSRQPCRARREGMADHLDAPGLTSPATDARVDITDHYAFQKPGDPNRTILILNVNPLAPTHANEFRHDAVYETLVDTNSDAK